MGCPWKLLYAVDLMLMAESMEELVEKFQRWKDTMECKGLWVNIRKTKVIYEHDTGQIAEGDKWPCSVCRKGVGRNSIFCNDCMSWVHKRCWLGDSSILFLPSSFLIFLISLF